MNFAKTFFASLLAFVAGNIVLGFFGFFLLVMFAAMVGENFTAYATPKLKANSVLMIDLKEGITDSPSASPFVSDGLGRVRIDNSNTILQAVAAVENAASDHNISGIYINVGYGDDISLANTEELRAALEKFRESGKFIISYADNYSQSGYYLSSVADLIYLNPEGEIDWRGISSGVMFYKGLLDKLDIRAEIIRHGSFKSAVEPFMLDRMSPENREQMNTILGSIWDAILSDISESRGIDKQVLSAYASDLTIASPEMAYDAGMIDGILYEDQVIDMLGRLAEGYETIGDYQDWEEYETEGCGEEEWTVTIEQPGDTTAIYMTSDCIETESAAAFDFWKRFADAAMPDKLEAEYTWADSAECEIPEDADCVEETGFEVAGIPSPVPNVVSLYDYIKSVKSGHKGRASEHKIAIVYADGEITSGESQGGSISGNTIVEKLRSAREDGDVKAVVLRVNSPGGSMLGSEVIWREMELTRLEKPVVVSMGGMAASGGYYIACPADVIMADRTTLTGSIGVFSILFDVGEALDKNLGITVDVAKTNPSADIGSGFRGLSGFERRFYQKQVEAAYETFIGHVADGRNMTPNAVDAIGGGRVWSGVDASLNGLIDGNGGIMDAITLAAERAGVGSDYNVWEVVDSPDNISAIMRSLIGSEEISVNSTLGETLRHYNAVINMLDAQHAVQARILYDIEIL